MTIKSIRSKELRCIWENDDLSVLPSLYSFEVRDVMFDLDAAQVVDDLLDIGAIQYHADSKESWSVTITVNNVEPCGAVICDFWRGDCYNVDLRVYEP